MKTVFSLLLTALALFTTTSADSANADVISPIDENAFIRLTLPHPETDYISFTVEVDGQPALIGQVISVDSGSRCIKFSFATTHQSFRSYQSEHCGDFKAGSTTEVPIFGLKLATSVPTDAVYGDVVAKYSIVFSNSSFTTSIPHSAFGTTPLIPFTNWKLDNSNIGVSYYRDYQPITIDPVSSIAVFTNPADALPPITFKRHHTKLFPDAKPSVLRLKRIQFSATAPTKDGVITYALPNGDLTLNLVKFPWIVSDELSIEQVGSDATYVFGSYELYHAATPTAPSSYPTVVNVHRIDVDDITIVDANGNTQTVKGRYSIFRDDTNSPIFKDEPTRTGVDVLPGRYTVVVRFDDPFSKREDTKVYTFDFK
ncbi:MAG: hypothetical protein JNJ49_05180 [Bdellovibrionaceae bacterium]|nr:hypothetical protein [Pseudobdellovibrionaceae bacterium]